MSKTSQDRAVAAFVDASRTLTRRTLERLEPSTRQLVSTAVRRAGASLQLKFEPTRDVVRLDLAFNNGKLTPLLLVELEAPDDDDDEYSGYGPSNIASVRGGGRR